MKYKMRKMRKLASMSSTMEDLNDDCIFLLLNLLSLKDQDNMAEVNFRFKDIVERFKRYKHSKGLDFEKEYRQMEGHFSEREIFDSFVKRAKYTSELKNVKPKFVNSWQKEPIATLQNVTSLSVISSQYNTLDPTVGVQRMQLNNLPERFPNLAKLDLSWTTLRFTDPYMFKRMTHLSDLTILTKFSYGTDHMSYLMGSLKYCHNLKSLQMSMDLLSSYHKEVMNIKSLRKLSFCQKPVGGTMLQSIMVTMLLTIRKANRQITGLHIRSDLEGSHFNVVKNLLSEQLVDSNLEKDVSKPLLRLRHFTWISKPIIPGVCYSPMWNKMNPSLKKSLIAFLTLERQLKTIDFSRNNEFSVKEIKQLEKVFEDAKIITSDEPFIEKIPHIDEEYVIMEFSDEDL